jgi:hypothetical protein
MAFLFNLHLNRWDSFILRLCNRWVLAFFSLKQNNPSFHECIHIIPSHTHTEYVLFSFLLVDGNSLIYIYNILSVWPAVEHSFRILSSKEINMLNAKTSKLMLTVMRMMGTTMKRGMVDLKKAKRTSRLKMEGNTVATPTTIRATQRRVRTVGRQAERKRTAKRKRTMKKTARIKMMMRMVMMMTTTTMMAGKRRRRKKA